MSLITTPPSIETAPEASQDLLKAVKSQLGVVPNLFRLVSNSPAALKGHLGLMGALKEGTLPSECHERIALAVAQVNGCSYCLSAHSYLAKNVAKLSDDEISANIHGTSKDAKANAAVKFAVLVAKERGNVNSNEIQALKQAGFSEAQIIEIVLHVALNTWTNYINNVAKTDIDFPVVSAHK